MHEHIIGILYHPHFNNIVTAKSLASNIFDAINPNEYSRDIMYLRGWKSYTVKQYADFSCSTNLERFKYCPECGEKIDWKQVRIEIEEELDGRGYAEKN